MARGGARARSGPPPDPNALRRDRKDDKEWLDIPASGRQGPSPEWPLPPDVRAVAIIEYLERMSVEIRDQWATEDDSRKAAALGRKLERTERELAERQAVLAQREAMELSFWSELWALPQAIVWERQNQNWEVALYCRRMIEAQERGSAVNLSTLVRQMADSLGLTTPGLRSNRWRIVDEATTPKTSAAARSRPSARDRLKVVKGGSS